MHDMRGVLAVNNSWYRPYALTSRRSRLYAFRLNGFSTACALLEFVEALMHILKVLYSVGIGVTATRRPTLDIAGLCLSSWPAAKFSDAYVAQHISQMHSYTTYTK